MDCEEDADNKKSNCNYSHESAACGVVALYMRVLYELYVHSAFPEMDTYIVYTHKHCLAFASVTTKRIGR